VGVLGEDGCQPGEGGGPSGDVAVGGHHRLDALTQLPPPVGGGPLLRFGVAEDRQVGVGDATGSPPHGGLPGEVPPAGQGVGPGGQLVVGEGGEGVLHLAGGPGDVGVQGSQIGRPVGSGQEGGGRGWQPRQRPATG